MKKSTHFYRFQDEKPAETFILWKRLLPSQAGAPAMMSYVIIGGTGAHALVIPTVINSILLMAPQCPEKGCLYWCGLSGHSTFYQMIQCCGGNHGNFLPEWSGGIQYPTTIPHQIFNIGRQLHSPAIVHQRTLTRQQANIQVGNGGGGARCSKYFKSSIYLSDEIASN